MANLMKASNAICVGIAIVVAAASSEIIPTGAICLQFPQQIADMAVNGSGIRDTARVLRISPTTVIEELKKTSTVAACK